MVKPVVVAGVELAIATLKVRFCGSGKVFMKATHRPSARSWYTPGFSGNFSLIIFRKGE